MMRWVRVCAMATGWTLLAVSVVLISCLPWAFVTTFGYAFMWMPPIGGLVIVAMPFMIGVLGILLIQYARSLRRRYALGHCRRCGYDLRGSHMTGRCPECGLPV